MKHIRKRPEPQELLDFKAAKTNDWTPSYDNLTTETKSALKQSLMQEQGWLCCYCEAELDVDDSHIEHLRPQYHYPAQELDYNNLLCSCQSRLKRREPRHCGASKDNWYDQALMISPLDSACEGYFYFTGDGRIYPRNGNHAADETIKRLRLGIDKLNAMRAAAIEKLIDLDKAEISNYLTGNAAGKFPPFFTAIRDVLG